MMTENTEKELTLSQIQKEALAVLIELDSLCKKHGWKYFITYGTLLGAVRHKGFIPWDDDVDVQMPRNDFEAFSSWCETHEAELFPFKLCSVRTVKNYPYGLARFANMNFKYETTNKYQKPFDLGVFVDVYPLDNYCNTYEEGLRLCKKVIRKNRLISIYCSGKTPNGAVKKIAKGLFHGILHIFGGNTFPIKESEKIVNLIKKATRESDCYIGVPSWTSGCYQFKKTWFEKSVLLRFEGFEFNAPACYHDFLTFLYGDYMQLPPAEQRRPYHEYKIYSRYQK